MQAHPKFNTIKLFMVALTLSSLVNCPDGLCRAKKATKKVDPILASLNYINQAKEAKTMGELDKSIKLYLLAFNLRYNASGYRDPVTVDIARKVAQLYLEKQDWANCEHYLDWATKALVREHGHGDYSLAPVFEDYSRLYKAQKKYDRALIKQKQAVQMYSRKDESSPVVYDSRVELGNLLALMGEYDQAKAVLKSADTLKNDYEYSLSETSKLRADNLSKLIKDRPPVEKIAVEKAKPVHIADTGTVLVKQDNQNKPQIKEVEKPAKPAAYASTPININTVSIENLDQRTVVDGPLEEERAMLLEFISKSNRFGIGIKPYVAAFDQIEEMVTKGQDTNAIQDRINSISDSLKRQFYRKALMKDPRYRLKHTGASSSVARGETSKRKFGVNPNWQKYEVAKDDAINIEDKYDGTPITEGYLRQIEQEVVRKEMQRMPGDMKYTQEGNEWFKRLSRQAQRKRINNWRNKEQRMDYR